MLSRLLLRCGILLIAAALGCGKLPGAKKAYQEPDYPENASIQAHVPPESFRFDSRVGEARITAGPPADDSKFLWRYSFEGEAKPWAVTEGNAQCAIADNALVVETQTPAQLDGPGMIGVSASSTEAVLIHARVTGCSKFTLAWSGEGGTFLPESQAAINTAQPEGWMLYVIDTSPLESWRKGISNIGQLRILLPENAKMELRSIGLAQALDPAAGKSSGQLDHLRMPREMIHTLFARTPCALEYDVKIMPDARLTTGLFQPNFLPARFRIVLKDGQEQTVLSEQSVDKMESYREVKADLSQWAGKTVQIRFEAESEPAGKVAMWCNPAIERVFPVTEARRPINVIWYVIDCLRASNVGAYGYPRDTTPAIDDLAEEGARFEWCFSPGSWTVDTVASYLTGLSPNAHAMMRKHQTLPESMHRLPEILRNAGYSTVMFTQNPYLERYTGYLRGFDEAYRFRVRDVNSRRGGTAANYPLNVHIAEFLMEHRERPFFMYVHSVEPHGPYIPPASLRIFSQPDRSVIKTDLYDDCIFWADANFFHTTQKLKEAGLWNNTLLIVSADHGQCFPEWDNGLDGHGDQPYLSRVRIPLVMRLPDVIPKGLVIGENVDGRDVPATLFDLLQLEPDPQFEGSSLMGLIDGSKKAEFAQRIVYPTGQFLKWQAAVKDKWFFLDNDGKSELIDLHANPHQSANVAEANPAIVQELLEAANQFRAAEVAKAEQFAVQSTEIAVVDVENQQALEAMGYIK